MDRLEFLGNNIKAKMDRDEVVASMTVRLVRMPEIANLAKAAGFDSLYVDMKHAPISLEATSHICQAAIAAGITPLVRLAANTPDEISRVLDAGSLGVIAPQVRSADAVREIVKAAKFPPWGERSVAGHPPQLAYESFAIEEVNRILNGATVVAINLETKAALDAIEEIATIEGLDLVSIGTNDLTTEFGVPGQHDHRLVRDAYERTIAACRAHGKHVGVGGLSNRPDLVTQFVQLGARYVSTGYDLGFLLGALRERATFVKEISL